MHIDALIEAWKFQNLKKTELNGHNISGFGVQIKILEEWVSFMQDAV